jgi:aryl-alcohol dehydrogenase-like predicted oxidoreductase
VQIPTNVGEMVDLAVVGPTARQRGVGLIGRQPFAHGAVFSDPRLRVLLEASTGRSPAQVALRFALDLDGLDSLLVGMRTLNHLTENLGTLDAPALSAAEVQALREITQVR